MIEIACTMWEFYEMIGRETSNNLRGCSKTSQLATFLNLETSVADSKVLILQDWDYFSNS